jgi:hypothetical protein
MSNDKCERCGSSLIEIDHWGERLMGCPMWNRWQASTGESELSAKSHKDRGCKVRAMMGSACGSFFPLRPASSLRVPSGCGTRATMNLADIDEVAGQTVVDVVS